jgi:polysaccharide biosynthesis protein PelE
MLLEKPMNIKDLKTIILALILFCCEFLLLYTMTSLTEFFVWHLLVLLILTAYVYFIYRREENLLYPLILLALTLGAGPFGLGAFLLVVIFYPLFSYFATPESIWFEGLFPKPSQTLFERIIQRIGSRWNDYNKLHEASSFKNLFTYGSLLDKQMVLDAIIEDFDPQYSPLLNLALQDPQNAVRIQAAAIVTKIEYDFDNELYRMQNLHQEFPDDLGFLLQLAKHADGYASLGILNVLRQEEMASLAIQYYRDYFKAKPDNKNIWLDIGRLLFYKKDYAAYFAWYEEGEKRFGSLPTIYHSWYLESEYSLGHPGKEV